VYCLQACRYLTGQEPLEVQAMENQPTDEPRSPKCRATVVADAVPRRSADHERVRFGRTRAGTSGGLQDGGSSCDAFAYRGQELY
jgi:hypothetical protein